jgi:DtxR family Mn-dependent transcriptional regulator
MLKEEIEEQMSKLISLSASLEDYIEAIAHIVDEKKVARGKEIAKRLKVSRASVTEALRALSKKGLVNYEPYEVITLTEKGKEVAEDVIRRHEALKEFFVKVLAIDDTIAEESACRIEHAAPPEVIDRLIRFVKFMEVCPRGGADLIKGFSEYCEKGRTKESCEECLSHTLKAPSVS